MKKYIYTENVYPRITPSSPIENKEANDYRLKHIKDVKQELERTSDTRKSLRKRF